jgi:hypothetical protein
MNRVYFKVIVNKVNGRKYIYAVEDYKEAINIAESFINDVIDIQIIRRVVRT